MSPYFFLLTTNIVDILCVLLISTHEHLLRAKIRNRRKVVVCVHATNLSPEALKLSSNSPKKGNLSLSLSFQGLEFTTIAVPVPSSESNGPAGGNVTPEQIKSALRNLLRTHPKNNEEIFDWIDVSWVFFY